MKLAKTRIMYKLASVVAIAVIVVTAFPTADVSAAQAAVAAPKTNPTTTKISAVPSPFATTNGEVLTSNMAIFGGARALMIGGNFSQIYTPDGRAYAATNFAILDLNNPNRVIYAAKGVNSYVRSVYAHASVLYAVGDFTTFDGQPRNRTAALGTDLRLKSWNPGSNSRIYAVTANDTAVFYGAGAGQLRAVRPANHATPGAIIWTKTATGGAVRALQLSPNKYYLYVGGMFEKVGGQGQHGLVKLRHYDGANYAAFKPIFRPDSGVGPKGGWDGDCILSLAWDTVGNRIIVGSGGATRNQMSVLNPTTGSGTNAAWDSPNRKGSLRNSEGDVQAVAIIGDAMAMGYHRGHVNLDKRTYYSTVSWPTKRMMTLWDAQDGSIQTWDAGFYGSVPNVTEANGGVQSITYDAASKKMVVGGSFMGWGDPYNNTGGSDVYGAPGTPRRSLAMFTVQ